MPYSVPHIVASLTPLTPGEIQESFHRVLERDVKYLILRESTYDEWVTCHKEDGDWTAELDASVRATNPFYYAVVAD